MNDQGECKEDGDAGGTGEHGIFLAKHNAYLARRTRGRTAWFRFFLAHMACLAVRVRSTTGSGPKLLSFRRHLHLSGERATHTAAHHTTPPPRHARPWRAMAEN